MLSGKSFGYPDKKFNRHAKFYLGLQVTIWAKVVLFVVLFGSGVVIFHKFPPLENKLFVEFGYYFAHLGEWSLVDSLDFWFHQIMHGLIALAVFVFARNAKRFRLLDLLKLFVLAAFFHNVFYWFSGVMTDVPEIAFDYATDVLALFVFFFVFKFLSDHVRFVKTFRVPWLDEK